MGSPSDYRKHYNPTKNKSYEEGMTGFEKAFVGVVLQNQHLLNNPIQFTEVASAIRLAANPYIENGELIGIDDIKPDWNTKELGILCRLPEEKDKMYDNGNRKWVVLSWKTLNETLAKMCQEQITQEKLKSECSDPEENE